MAASVNTIQEIVKWAEKLPDWQSDALRRLFVNGKLSDDEKLDVINLAKQENGLSPSAVPPTAIPFTAVHAPGQSSSTEVTYLKKIRDLKHVNALAGEQTLSFGGKGITVIYGDNGTGKSGYSRLLKRACRARHTEVILPNIHNPSSSPCTPEAIFDIEKDKSDKIESLTWQEGSLTPDSLSQIAVFDTHCARVFVDDANTVNFMPYGLDVFPKLAALFDDLKEKLTSERIQLLHRDEIIDELQGEHDVGKLINTLSSKTDVSKIEKLTTITDDEEKEFIKLDVAVKDLQANDPQKQAIAIRRTKTRIQQHREQLKSNYKTIGSDAVSKLRDAWNSAKTKAEAAKLASSAEFTKEPLTGVGSEAWIEMYKHAREYSVKEAYPGKDYPVTDEGSHCPLCMQELSDDAQDRLLRFEKYVSDKTEKDAAVAKANLVALFKPIKELSISKVDEILLSEVRDIDSETADLLANAEKEINIIKDSIVTAVKKGEWESAEENKNEILQKLKLIADDLEEKAKNKDKLVNPEKQ